MTTLYCPKCGYNLSNLTENRCPECGEAFDPDTLRAQQRLGISSLSVILQLIFVPAGIAVLLPIGLIVGLSIPIAGIFIAVGFPLGLIVLHTYFLARAYVRARKLRNGEDNVPWLFRRLWACCLLFTLVEAGLAFGYFAGGCAVILMNLNFH